MSKCSIYVLKDPNTLDIRYVGKTTTALSIRLAAHISSHKSVDKYNWIQSLLNANKAPIIECIEVVDNDISALRELEWIQYYFQQGCDLLNENGLTRFRTNDALNWIKKNGYFLKIKKIEEETGLPDTTLQWFVAGKRGVDKKWWPAIENWVANFLYTPEYE